MKKNYNGYDNQGLRSKCLNGELKHKCMTEENYLFLFDHERNGNDNSNGVIINFCRTGLKRLGKYKKYKFMFKKGKYDDLSYEEMREKLLNSELEHKYMNIYNYCLLFDFAEESDESISIILEFSIEGLKKFDDYEELANIKFDIADLTKYSERIKLLEQVYNANDENQRDSKKSITFFIIPKPAAVAACAVLSVCLLITVTAAAMGYNILDLIRNAISSPGETVVNDNGDDMRESDSFTEYESVDKMIESVIDKAYFNEIIHFKKLPVGYEFTNYRVTVYDNFTEVRSYATKQNINYRILIGAERKIGSLDYRAKNGLKYSIVEIDGMYQANWVRGYDYYELVVDDKDVLIEIMDNMGVFSLRRKTD